MYLVVTFRAHSDEVLLVIVSLLTAETLVMDLEAVAGAADLTLPTITLQHAFPQLLV